MNFLSRMSATEAPGPHRLTPALTFLLLVAFSLFTAFRLPGAWSYGRFLDEEVTVFFAYAWNFDPLNALLRPFAGYWNLAANGIALLLAEAVRADVISLERAPYVTMVSGLVAQLLPIYLLLTGTASWLNRGMTRLVACFLVVLTPGVDEVYLNSVHIQFHLALCVGIILALEVQTSRPGQLLAAAILFIAPLCGPGAITLLPLFGLRALIDRDRGRWIQLGFLAAGAAIQLLVFYSPSAARGMPPEPALLAAGLFVRLIILPIFGPLAAVILGSQSYKAEAAGNLLIVPVLGLVAIACFAILTWWSLKRRDSAPWLVGGALLVAGVSFGLGAAGQAKDAHLFALMPLYGPRYNYLPLVMLALAMLVLANRPTGSGRKWARGLVMINLAVGFLFFGASLPAYSRGPAWPREVAAWRANPDYQLRAWPETVKADLSGRRFECPERVVLPGNIAHPRYCESGWVAAFYVPADQQQ